MSIKRVLLFSAVATSLCFSTLACGQQTADTRTSSEVLPSESLAAAAEEEDPVKTAVGSEATRPAPDISTAQQSGVRDIEATSDSTEQASPEQVYAGETSPSEAQKSGSTRIQLAQRRFDDGCINLLAYDPEDTYVNVRDQPGGDVVRSLPNFALIQSTNGPIRISEGWNEVFISMTQSKGYIHSDLISHTTYEILDTSDTSANLRSSPDGEVVTALPNGTIVRFLSRQGSWSQVETQAGATGYIASSLLAPPSCY